MKVNTGKIYLLASGNVRATANIDKIYSDSEKEQVLLGITIDSNLTFENQTNNICKIASQKINALASAASYKNMQKKRIIIIFIIYVVYTIIYKCEFVDFLAFVLFV